MKLIKNQKLNQPEMRQIQDRGKMHEIIALIYRRYQCHRHRFWTIRSQKIIILTHSTDFGLMVDGKNIFL